MEAVLNLLCRWCNLKIMYIFTNFSSLRSTSCFLKTAMSLVKVRGVLFDSVTQTTSNIMSVSCANIACLLILLLVHYLFSFCTCSQCCL
jgi:hypothetical protein